MEWLLFRFFIYRRPNVPFNRFILLFRLRFYSIYIEWHISFFRSVQCCWITRAIFFIGPYNEPDFILAVEIRNASRNNGQWTWLLATTVLVRKHGIESVIIKFSNSSRIDSVFSNLPMSIAHLQMARIMLGLCVREREKIFIYHYESCNRIQACNAVWVICVYRPMIHGRIAMFQIYTVQISLVDLVNYIYILFTWLISNS